MLAALFAHHRAVGGHTEFADQRAAYDALPDAMKKKLEGLVAEHSIATSRRRSGFTNFTEDEGKRLPPVPQLLVRTIPESGRKSLYVASHAGRIFDMPDAEGRALIDELIAHVTQRQFVYTHRWRPNELVMWDNRCTMHRGTDYDDLRWVRDMHRTTVSDVANTCEQAAIPLPITCPRGEGSLAGEAGSGEDNMYYPSNWIHSFPQNFQWSNATLVCKGMAPYGAVALGEIDWIVQRLHERANEEHAWWEEWCAVGGAVERSGDEAAAAGHHATAGNYYLRAGNYYYTGERMVPPGEQKTAMYKKALRCFVGGAEAPLSESRDRRRAVRRLAAAGVFPEVASRRKGARRPSSSSTASTTARR